MATQKYIKTIKCGCGVCRFRPRSSRAWVCPLEKSVEAIWLWGINPEFLSTAKLVPDDAEPVTIDGQEFRVV